MIDENPTQQILERLRGVKKSGDGYSAFCPAHEDTKRPSLTVTEAEDGRALVHCHKNCSYRDIMAALGLEAKHMFPKPIKTGKGKKRTYKVRDATGRVRAVHHREQNPDGSKRVWWATPDGEDGLQGVKVDSLPLWGAEAIGSVDPDTPIILVEGEKAASALTWRDIPAVATVTGAAGTPSKEVLCVLAGRKVVIWADNDDEGKKHMRRVGKILQNLDPPAEVQWYEWDEAQAKDDAADHPAILLGGEDAEKLVSEVYAAPRFIAPHDPATDGASTFIHVLDEYRKLRKMRRATGGITGIRLGIPAIDKGTHGFNKGDSYLIGGRPSHGKSLLAGQIALTAAQSGHRVLLQTPEMSEVQYMDRFACYIAGVDYFKAQDGEISDLEDHDLDGAAELIATALPILVDGWGGQTVERIRENIERHEPELVVVDYLQFLNPDDYRQNRNQQVGQISRDLAALKSDYPISLVIATQLNRDSEKRHDSSPQLWDLRDSGELEQDADLVMNIYRPDIGDDDVRGTPEEEIQLLCRKHRMGKLWQVSLSFVPGQQWLQERILPGAEPRTPPQKPAKTTRPKSSNGHGGSHKGSKPSGSLTLVDDDFGDLVLDPDQLNREIEEDLKRDD